MPELPLQYCGSFTYPDNSTLERALAAARTELEVDTRAIGFLRVFVTHGNELSINVTIADIASRRSAAARMLRLLEADALRAAVRCFRAGREMEMRGEP